MPSPPASPIRVLLVDDHPIVLEGLRVMLATISYVEIVGNATSAAEALAAVRATHPHIVLLDLILPDGDGIEVCRQLRAEWPATRVIALTILKERRYLLRAREAGAAGYVLKNVSTEELAEALLKVHAGKIFFSDDMQELLASPDDGPAKPLLTRREKEILPLVANGLTSHEIAARLCVSYLTVETHRRNLLIKFGVHNTAALIKLATEQGMVG